MTLKEALAQAKKTGGNLDWSKEKDWFVTGGIAPYAPGQRHVFPHQFPWWEGWGFVPPWMTPKEEGWLGFGTRKGLIGKGQYTRIEPRLSWQGQKQLESLYGAEGWRAQVPGLKPTEATPEELTSYYDELYNTLVAPKGISKELWEAYGRPVDPTQLDKLSVSDLIGMEEQFVRLEPQDGYLVPVYRDEKGNERMAWEGAKPTREAEAGVPTEWQQANLDWAREQWEAEHGLAKERFGWEQQQWQQQLEMQQQQHLAQLAANPMSWLQYAAEAGQQAAIQPWMMPLMSQQYPSLQAGQPIPGFKGTEGMTGMPELLRPSAQYQARMGPTSLQQYYGYQQAQQGARPEETQFRRWNEAPPGGSWTGLRYRR